VSNFSLTSYSSEIERFFGPPNGYQLIMLTILHDAIALLSRSRVRRADTLLARC